MICYKTQFITKENTFNIPKFAVSYIVQPSDNLFLLAQKFYGRGNLWPLIYNANRDVIGNNFQLLKLGMHLIIPPKNQPVMSKGSFTDLLEALGEFESGLPSGDLNQYRVENSLGLVGKYQFSESLCIDLGYYRAKIYYGHGADKNYWQGTWTGKKGIDSKSKFQNSPDIQEFAIREAFKLNWERINSSLKGKGKAINDYIGQQKTFKDNEVSKTITITLSGILAAAHLRGPYGVAELLLKTQAFYDEYAISILRYMEKYGSYDTTLEDFLNPGA